MEKKADIVFELSWEVCNKVGGIYTVVTSKAARMVEYYGENYFTIGPYFPKKALGEFKEEIIPDFLKEAFENLRKEGIIIRYGKWLIQGQPNTILIDFSGFTGRKNEIKRELWDSYKIDSLNTTYFDYEEPIIWGWAAGRVIEEISRKLKDKKICAHIHEWLSGSALLYLKKNAKVATVFTTHATVLGRSISSSSMNLYANLKNINPDKECYSLGIPAKHQTEMQSARNADVFSTVSEITGMEATSLLGRKPDIVLPNGLDLKKFPTFEQASISHQHIKKKIKEFIAYYFFPYYAFPLDDTLIYFLSGRYEFRDKGIDTFINSLGKLNEQLKKEKSSKTIVAFFWVPGNIRGIKPDLLENRTFYQDIRETIDDSIDDVKTRLLYSLINETIASCGELFGNETLLEVHRKLLRFKRKGFPPLSTHDLYDEDKDDILNAFKKNNLLNREEDNVKVIFYPIYLTGADGLLDLTYYESMQGSHLGVFPSYYEPWGYTPLEAGALGVSSVTTDLAGFGRYIQKKESGKAGGIYVIKRYDKKDSEVVEELASVMYSFANMTADERVKNKIRALHLAALADWELMAKNYVEAHNLAIEKKFEGKK